MASNKKTDSLHNDLIDTDTVGIAEAPMWTRENENILTGYRRVLSPIECVKSLTYLHNESMNILSHVLGAAIFAVLAWITESPTIVSFVDGCTWCFVWSAIFHLMLPVSEFAYMVLAKCDYSGITIAIASSSMAIVKVSMRNSIMAFLITTYQMGVSVSLIVFIWLNIDFHLPQYRDKRALLFFAYALAVNIPIVLIVVSAFDPTAFFHSSAVAAAASFAVGLVFYTGRITESYFPSPFTDVWCPSHAVFHVLVVVGSLFLYKYLIHLSLSL